MSKKSYRKELIEWTIIVVVGLTLYVTGLHTEVIGQIQRVVLATGIMQPEADDEKATASYDLRLSNIAGKPVSFSTFRGQTIFLNFWATWCPPCIAEMPDIEDLYQKMGKDVTFVMISLDEDRDKARRSVDRKGFELPVYFLESPLPSPYNPSSIPPTYVISPDGQVVLTRHGMAKYDTEEFRAFLSTLTPK